MIDAPTLLADSRHTVTALMDDLRGAATSDPNAAAHVAAEYQRAHAAGRTAFGQAEWAEGLYAQVAVAWTLGCVFVRFCEDNDLITEPLLGGPGLRLQLALDQRAAHLQANPAHDDRDWLRDVFGRLRHLPATGEIFGAHNPIWLEGLLPSADGARRLREDLTRIDPDTGQLRHDFTDSTWDTRFLGDLYQDLSDHAKKTYALLQTPVFVEEFILGRALDPAIATFGLADTTIIDPTCGSGHFLLGAFDRIFERWVDAEPATNRRALAQRSLDAIGGIDLNPFAASIARFRLLLAALRAGGDNRLADAPAYDLNIAVGDSLLHGDPPGALPGMHIPGEEEALLANHGYAAEDHAATRDLLSRGWAAVVGNPPYITARDPALNAAYRQRFKTCSGKYSLGVPFTERFWQLARSEGEPERAGFVGLITSNSFMKREFGKKLVEEWFPKYDVTHVLDASGAFIPGHGTPTVLLFGRNRRPVESTVRAVMGIRGEPTIPSDPQHGLVWTSLVELVNKPGSQSGFVSAVDLDRGRLRTHPWSIGGGGAAELKDQLDLGAATTLASVTSVIGVFGMTNADEVFLAPRASQVRHTGTTNLLRSAAHGDAVRDWRIEDSDWSFFPYVDGQLVDVQTEPGWCKRLWPFRTTLWARATFSKQTYRAEGRPWWEWHQVTLNRLLDPTSIVFANISTHNHFVVDDSGGVFNVTAPIIKMLSSDHASQATDALCGLLNSSTAEFWIRQVMFHKPSNGVKRGLEDEAWESRVARDGTKLRKLPLPAKLPTESAALASSLAARLRRIVSDLGDPSQVPRAESVDARRRDWAEMRQQLIAAQERLDWKCYRLYELIEGDLTTGDELEPPLELGERAFEIVLARRIAGGEGESSWFSRHGSTPITELPAHWTPAYRTLIERRIELIETDPNVGLIERPEHKRRWASKSWDEQVANALRGWLLDRLESRRYWPETAAITTVARLTAEARTDEDFMQVARLYAGRDDVDLARLIDDLVAGESVAYLAAHRYTDSGLRQYTEWLKTWGLQRREDAGEDVGMIPTPPKYAKADFMGVGWEHRGKLDMPKERFISYPGAERETDASAVIGWAGWDHLERARALAAWYLQAKRDGRGPDHLVPLLAGLAELVPWLRQWYDEPNADPSLDRPGSQVSALVDTETRSQGLTAEDLVSWRPPVAAKRGRPRKSTS